jgi:hypothetical protein
VIEAALGGHGKKLVEGIAAEDLVNALGGLTDRWRYEQGVGSRVELEVHFRMGECVMRNERCYMRELSGFGAEKFAAGRGVEEEVADGDGGAGRAAGVFDGEDFAAGNFEACTCSGIDWVAGGRLLPGYELEARDGGDGGKRFAAEAEGSDSEEVVGGMNFGGGVTFEGEEGVVAGHAAAVVGNTDEAAAAGFDFDADAGGASVERILQQFLDDGGGAVDDLAGGDLVGDLVGENMDASHIWVKDTRGLGVEKWFSFGRRPTVAGRLRGVG